MDITTLGLPLNKQPSPTSPLSRSSSTDDLDPGTPPSPCDTDEKTLEIGRRTIPSMTTYQPNCLQQCWIHHPKGCKVAIVSSVALILLGAIAYIGWKYH